MTLYVGILDGKSDVWGVRFPDVPGCYGGGESPEAAYNDAVSALENYAEHLAKEGGRLPLPRHLGELVHDPEVRDAFALGEVAVLVLAPDAARAAIPEAISLDPGLLDLIGAEAKARGLSLSAFVASAAREKIASSK